MNSNLAASAALLCAAMAAGYIGAALQAPAQAHGVGLTRFEIQNAVTQAMQRQQQSAGGLSAQEVENAVARVLARCRFQGQFPDADTAEEDSVDFQGTLRC